MLCVSKKNLFSLIIGVFITSNHLNLNARNLQQKHQTIINSNVKPLKDLIKLKNDIQSLEQELNALNANVQEHYQSILSQKQDLIHIIISSNLTQKEFANFEYIEIKIDGFALIQREHSFETSRNNINIYDGPLDPGRHIIEISSKVALMYPEHIPTNEVIYKNINKIFNIDIPTGKYSKKFEINIIPPTNQKHELKATIFEKSIEL